MPNINLLILIAVLLPPKALDLLGTVVDEKMLQTPYGDFGPLALRVAPGQPAVWVGPYTGLPTRTDPRATLFAAGMLGLQRILTWEEGIALNPILRRGQATLATDYIDWTRHQPATFFMDKHLSLISDPGTERKPPLPPFCPQMTHALRAVLPYAPEVVYVGVDGPRRETAAEARMFRLLGADVLGSNLTPEVALANELGICYAGLVTIGERSVDQPAKEPQGELRSGLEATLQILPTLIQQIAALPECTCAE
jgi:5'-methylthioadenosine phosphorylase